MMLRKDLAGFTSQFKEYTELRAQELRNFGLVYLNGNLIHNNYKTSAGISARAFKDGAWGFSSAPAFTDDAVKSVIAASTDNARFLASRHKRAISNLPHICGQDSKDLSSAKSRPTQKELIEFLRALDARVGEKYPDLASRQSVLFSSDLDKSLVTSEGSVFTLTVPSTFIFIILAKTRDEAPIEIFEAFGGLGEFQDNFSIIDKLMPEIDAVYEHLCKKTEGVFAEAGVHDVVLDADLAGILAHEAIGHTTEADLVLGGSVAADLLGQQIADPLITLVDIAHTYNGDTCPVPIFIDDEGTVAEDVTVIDKGVLRNFMHNKETAAHFDAKPRGNGRASDFFDEPLVRMRNTAILPGKNKLEDLISSVEKGYYLVKPGNGQADSTSEFMFGVHLGYEIKNGKLGRGIRDTTISGIAYEMLKSVTMISDEMRWLSAGMCGKKQGIPVGMGGPAIKCRVNIGGK